MMANFVELKNDLFLFLPVAVKARYCVCGLLLFESSEHLGVLVLDLLHLLFAVSSVESLVHRPIPESHALRNGAFVHYCVHLNIKNSFLC